MTYTEVEKYIEHMNPDGLISLCNDIYDWKYVTGTLKPDCSLNQLSENLQYCDISDIEKIVIRVAAKKLDKVVLLLMQNVPHEFMRTATE